MQSWQGGLETRVKARKTIDSFHSLKDFGREKRVKSYVHAIPGPENNVIHAALRSVIQPDAEAIPVNVRLNRKPSCMRGQVPCVWR